MRSVLRLLGSGLVIGLFCVIASAQAIQTGGITGVVTDKNGALVTGASVDVISDATGKSVRNVTTGGDGGYSVTLLPPGKYRLEISAHNFKKAVVSDVHVNITETTRQDVSLEPGNIQETVNIEASPTLINPASALTGPPLDGPTLPTFPLASPNYLFLLNLST